MPRQILFYMTREDESDFLEYIRSSGDTIVIPSRSPTSEFAPIDVLPEPSKNEIDRKFWLQNKLVNLPLVTEFVQESGYYVLDGFQSPVVEFIRSMMASRILLPGRLQADMVYFDDDRGDLVPKPAEFRRWFESIENWVRRTYKHLTLLTYMGPGAAKFSVEGGLLH